MQVCSVCGSSYDQIVKSQKIGCPECYFTFQKEIRDTLSKHNISENYKGSLPKRLKGYKSTLVSRVDMQLKLEEAIANEEYEKAALYRDYLKVLNSQKISNGENLEGSLEISSENSTSENLNELELTENDEESGKN